jgi:IclR family pca regulon transcriptional regulator
MTEDPRNHVASVGRGLRLLEVLAGFPDGASPRELLTETGFDRSGQARLMRSLVAAGYVERMERGRYGISVGALRLAIRLLDAPHLRRAAMPYLRALNTEVGEIVNFAVLSGVEVVYVARIAPRSILTMNLDVGSRHPASVTSLGRAILAWKPEPEARAILEQSDLKAFTEHTQTDPEAILAALRTGRGAGYVLVDQELELGLRAIAAPVFGHDGHVVGSIDISVPAARVGVEVLRRELAPRLTQTARAMSEELGGAPK